MAKPKKNKLDNKRSLDTIQDLMHCKGGPMRDRRLRREKERKNDWKKEVE